MRTLVILAIGFALTITACKKPAGEGGQASIKGRVYVRNYNTAFTVLNDQYYAQGEQVYIIYGDETAVGNNVRTSYDGSFEFPYLRIGNYKVYALSKDSTSSSLSKTVEVLMSVTITKKKEVVTLPTLTILN